MCHYSLMETIVLRLVRQICFFCFFCVFLKKADTPFWGCHREIHNCPLNKQQNESSDKGKQRLSITTKTKAALTSTESSSENSNALSQFMSPRNMFSKLLQKKRYIYEDFFVYTCVFTWD